MEPWSEYVRFLISLIVITMPLEAIPLYLTLVADRTPRSQRRIAVSVGLTAFSVLTVAAISGEFVLNAAGTSLASFKVGGGIVLLMLALSMLTATVSELRQTPAEAEEAGGRHAVGVVPLGVPLIAGPGAISTVIIEMDTSRAPDHAAAVIGCIAVVSLLVWLCLRLAQQIGRVLGQSGLNVIGRLFGLLLAGVAIELMTSGLRTLLPGLAG